MTAKDNTIKPKFKKCKVCKSKFQLFRTTQKVCSPNCAIALAKVDGAKKEKKSHSAAKRNLKNNDRTLQAKKAQAAFNKFIRLRDKGNVCISCQNPPLKKNAGHYKTTKAHPELRFCEAQVHLQCEHCNTHLSGNIYNYRPNLINKVGIEMVDWIEGPHELKRYTAANFITIKKWYTRRTKRMEQGL